MPDGVSIADNAKIVIDPEVNSNTTFELTVNAKSNESANYYASSSVSSTIKIAISSLWYKISSGTLYLSAFKTDKATIEAANVLDVTKLSEIP